ncbi:MAG: 5-oxoprolinase subunit PxpB, partial [Thermoanaerobaculia bacterium]
MSASVTGQSRGALREIVDGAARIEYPEATEADAGRAVVALHRALSTRRLPGVLDVVPGARTLLVLFDPRRLSLESLARAAGREGAGTAPSRDRRAFRIPVCYGGPGGPDLPGMAAHAGLTVAEFARRHAAARYAVGFVGFAPGFAYLRGLPEELHHPRLESPRTRVPQGSVGVGGSYTGIYPQETPGGWRLIGRAPVRLFDPAVDPPALLQPGDEVAFERIDEAELAARLAQLPPSAAPALRGARLFRLLASG